MYSTESNLYDLRGSISVLFVTRLSTKGGQMGDTFQRTLRISNSHDFLFIAALAHDVDIPNFAFP